MRPAHSPLPQLRMVWRLLIPAVAGAVALVLIWIAGSVPVLAGTGRETGFTTSVVVEVSISDEIGAVTATPAGMLPVSEGAGSRLYDTSVVSRVDASVTRIVEDGSPQVSAGVGGSAWVAVEVVGTRTTLSALVYTPRGLADDAAQLALPRGGANLSQQRLDHIIARHWHGSQTANAGHFASGTTGRGLTSMIDDTVRGGTFRPNTAGRPGTIFEHDLGRTIGTNAAGNSTSRLRVVVDPSGNVITAFPY